MKFERMVVGVDGSKESEAAVRWCADHVGADGEVIAVSSLSLFGEFVLSIPPSDISGWRADVHHALENGWTETLRARGVRYRTCMKDGTAWKELLTVAEEWHADAVVIGHRHHRLLTPGAVADQVVRRSHIPVVVVPVEDTGSPRRDRAVEHVASNHPSRRPHAAGLAQSRAPSGPQRGAVTDHLPDQAHLTEEEQRRFDELAAFVERPRAGATRSPIRDATTRLRRRSRRQSRS